MVASRPDGEPSAALEAEVVERLNEAKMENDADEKVRLLEAVAEILLHRDVRLMSIFQDDVVALQVDPESKVRRSLRRLQSQRARSKIDRSSREWLILFPSLRISLLTTTPSVYSKSAFSCATTYTDEHWLESSHRSLERRRKRSRTLFRASSTPCAISSRTRACKFPLPQ